MNAMPTAERMTAEEFLELAPLPGSIRRELVDGEVVVNSPSWMHNDTLGAIYAALRFWVRAGDARGAVNLPVDVKLDDRNVYQPDIVWYREGRAPTRDDLAPYPAPDIAVEVRSPSTWRFDIGAKKHNYERHGVAELWLVDTAADVVIVFRRSAAKVTSFDVSEELDAQATLISPLLPGLAVPVAEIFGA
jgi:Uma2 family endonuclease